MSIPDEEALALLSAFSKADKPEKEEKVDALLPVVRDIARSGHVYHPWADLLPLFVTPRDQKSKL